jgi:hypothetical protein
VEHGGSRVWAESASRSPVQEEDWAPVGIAVNLGRNSSAVGHMHRTFQDHSSLARAADALFSDQHQHAVANRTTEEIPVCALGRKGIEARRGLETSGVTDSYKFKDQARWIGVII